VSKSKITTKLWKAQTDAVRKGKKIQETTLEWKQEKLFQTTMCGRRC